MTHQPPQVPGDHLHRFAPDPDRGAEIEQKSPGERDPGLESRANTVRWGGLAALRAGLVAGGAVHQDGPRVSVAWA